VDQLRRDTGLLERPGRRESHDGIADERGQRVALGQRGIGRCRADDPARKLARKSPRMSTTTAATTVGA
jgi:hypothetical protein